MDTRAQISDRFPPGTLVRFTHGVDARYSSIGIIKSWEIGPAGPMAHIRHTGGRFYDQPDYLPTFRWYAMGDGEMEAIQPCSSGVEGEARGKI